MYFDELELCNPLGSRRTIHKIGTTLLCGVNAHERH